nr:hypothetical protein [Lachnospiraceae bacterium]
METEQFYLIWGDSLQFEFCPGGNEGRELFQLSIRDRHLWVNSTLLFKAVCIEEAPLPDPIARLLFKLIFPLSKWEIEQSQDMMIDGPYLEIQYSDADGRGAWIRAFSFSHEAAWDFIDAVFELCHLSDAGRLRNTLLFQKINYAEEGNMELQTICNEVLVIEEGLMYGTIPFAYDNLMSALKPGHPMEILDEMLAEIFWDVQAGREPSVEALKSTLDNFKQFRKVFKVQNMNAPIRHLTAYIKEKEAEAK